VARRCAKARSPGVQKGRASKPIPLAGLGRCLIDAGDLQACRPGGRGRKSLALGLDAGREVQGAVVVVQARVMLRWPLAVEGDVVGSSSTSSRSRPVAPPGAGAAGGPGCRCPLSQSPDGGAVLARGPERLAFQNRAPLRLRLRRARARGRRARPRALPPGEDLETPQIELSVTRCLRAVPYMRM